MPLLHRLSLDGLTFGDLYRFVDHARQAGIDEDQTVTVESTDNLGNELGAHTLVADLGDIDELSRPVLIDAGDARVYAESLSREINQESDQYDRPPLRRLLADLRNEPYPLMGVQP